WGLAPVWGMSVRLPERVGLSAAKLLMFTGRRLTSSVALAYGLVDQVVADEHLDDAVATLASEINESSRDSNRMIKALLRDAGGRHRRDALEHERSMPYGMPDEAFERLARRH